MPSDTARKAIQADEWISLFKASSALGESRLALLTRAVKGELKAKHVAGRTVISKESVDRLLAERAG